MPPDHHPESSLLICTVACCGTVQSSKTHHHIAKVRLAANSMQVRGQGISDIHHSCLLRDLVEQNVVIVPAMRQDREVALMVQDLSGHRAHGLQILQGV